MALTPDKIAKYAEQASKVCPEKMKRIFDWIANNPEDAKKVIETAKATKTTATGAKEAAVTDGKDHNEERGAVGRMGEFLQNFAKVADSATDIANVVPAFGQIAAVVGDLGSAAIEAAGVTMQVTDRLIHGKVNLAVAEGAGGAISCAMTAIPFIDQANLAAVAVGAATGNEMKSMNQRASECVRDWTLSKMKGTQENHVDKKPALGNDGKLVVMPSPTPQGSQQPGKKPPGIAA
jgi:hypothetical protein